MEKRKWIKPVFRVLEIAADVVTESNVTASPLEQGDCFGELNF